MVDIDKIYAALVAGRDNGQALEVWITGANARDLVRDRQRTIAEGIDALERLKRELRDGRKHLEQPDDYKHTSCYCSAPTCSPPCSFCTDPDNNGADLAPTTSTVSAPPEQVKHGEVPSIEITLRQAKELVDCFGGHDAEISIMRRPAAWADMPDGLYAYFSEYPDEGSMYLGPTEVDDELAQNGDAGTVSAPEDVRNEALDEGLEMAARHLDKQRQAVDQDHAYQESDTGAWVFDRPETEEYSNTLAELADEIRALKRTTSGKGEAA